MLILSIKCSACGAPGRVAVGAAVTAKASGKRPR